MRRHGHSGQIDTLLVPIAGSRPMIGSIEITQAAGAVQDVCQRSDFYYDVNPVRRRLRPEHQKSPDCASVGRHWLPGALPVHRNLQLRDPRPGGQEAADTSNSSCQSFQLETSQTHDNEGKEVTVKFPDTSNATGSTCNYTYDELAMPVKLVEDYLD